MDSFIKSALRSASNRWAPKHKCLKDCKIGRNQYVCSKCKSVVGHKGIKADHIDPVVSLEHGFKDWDEYVKRLFVEVDGYQAVCRTCHDLKTKEESELRKRYRQAG